MKKYSVYLLCISLFTLSACTTINYTAQNFVPHDPHKITHLKAITPAYQLDNLEFVQSDGAISRGVYWHKPDAEITVLYFMGSGVRIDANGAYFMKPFAALNANVISFDYRGFGRSDSADKPHGLKETQDDVLALYDHVRKMVKGKLVVHGHSFGSFVAAKLASLRPLDALVLEGTGTTAQAYGDNLVPWFAKPFITINLDPELLSIDNRASLHKLTTPILIINGADDKQTPEPTARELFDSLKNPNKRYEKALGMGHMNAMTRAETIVAYRAFLGGEIGEKVTQSTHLR